MRQSLKGMISPLSSRLLFFCLWSGLLYPLSSICRFIFGSSARSIYFSFSLSEQRLILSKTSEQLLSATSPSTYYLSFFCLSPFSSDLLNQEKLVLGERWATKRPEELSPTDFIQLTIDLFGEDIQPIRGSTTTLPSASTPLPPSSSSSSIDGQAAAQSDPISISGDRTAYVSRPVWRKALFGASGSPTFNAKPSDKK